MLELIFLALLLGIAAGTFTGLAPGIHINLIALLLFISSTSLLQFTTPEVLVIFIVSMAITHTFLDFITGIFLGCPDEENALSIMPGHQLLMEGKGYEAIRLTTIGCYIGLILFIISIPLGIIFIPPVYELLKASIPFILIAASLFLILKEENKFMAIFIFLMSGTLGLAVFNMQILNQPLFPLLTGLFGTSMLISSISQKTKIPKQKITNGFIEKREIKKAVTAGLFGSLLCSFLPGLGAAQAAVIGNQTAGKISQKGFLVLLGIISVLVTGLNFVALYIINKPRSGTAIIVGKLLESVNLQNLAVICITALIAGSISVFLSILFARIFAKNIEKIDYTRLNFAVLLILTILSIVLSGWPSLIVLITATSIGLVAISSGVRKMHMMGCLIIPVIFLLL